MPATIAVVIARHCHHCRRRQSKPYHKEAGPAGLSDPPLATPHVSTHEKRPAVSSSRHRARIASAMTISVKAVLGLRPPPPYPCVNSLPSWCPAVLCLSIVRPNAATADCDPSKPHMNTYAIVEAMPRKKT